MEDIDEKALSYGEIKALATGNPLILEKTNLDSEISKLKLLRQNFMNQKYALQDKVLKHYPEEITRLNNKIAAMEEDTIKLQEYTKPNMDGFSPMIIDGKEYSEKADAGKKLLECTQLLKSMEVREIGEYRGFKMKISFDSVTRNIKLKLKNKFSYTIDLGVDAGGNIIRINNCLENIARDIPLEREKLDSINAELKINDDDHEILGDEQEELIRNLDSEELKIKSNEEWIRKFEKNMHIDKLDNIIINELIEDIQVHDNGNINIIFKYQDEFIQAIDFIKTNNCVII